MSEGEEENRSSLSKKTSGSSAGNPSKLLPRSQMSSTKTVGLSDEAVTRRDTKSAVVTRKEKKTQVRTMQNSYDVDVAAADTAIAPETNALVAISKASEFLTKAQTLEQIVEIKDEAQAVAVYVRAKHLDGVHSQALELELRAERKAGQFLKEMPKNPGSRKLGGGSSELPPESRPKTLRELRIEKYESQRWQRLASIPDAEFEKVVAESKNATQRAALNLVRQYAPSSSSSPTRNGQQEKAFVTVKLSYDLVQVLQSMKDSTKGLNSIENILRLALDKSECWYTH